MKTKIKTPTPDQIRAFAAEAARARDFKGLAIAKRAMGLTVQQIYDSGCGSLGYSEIAHALRTPTNRRPMTADRARRMIAQMLVA